MNLRSGMVTALAGVLLLVVGCAQTGPSGEIPAAVEPQAKAEPAPEPAESFGGEIDESIPRLELAQIQTDPKPLLGRTVRTQGRVERVCKKRGCWLELTDSAGTDPLRVPMAGHAFFIPQHAVGRQAEIQGQLNALPLPEAHAEHVASEGATALGPLALEATAVKLLP